MMTAGRKGSQGVGGNKAGSNFKSPLFPLSKGGDWRVAALSDNMRLCKWTWKTCLTGHNHHGLLLGRGGLVDEIAITAESTHHMVGIRIGGVNRKKGHKLSKLSPPGKDGSEPLAGDDDTADS